MNKDTCQLWFIAINISQKKRNELKNPLLQQSRYELLSLVLLKKRHPWEYTPNYLYKVTETQTERMPYTIQIIFLRRIERT